MIVRVLTRGSLLIGLVAALVVPTLLAPSVASAAPPRDHPSVSLVVQYVPMAEARAHGLKDPSPSYVAGSSVAGRPSYDQSLWAKKYNCAFAGWAHVTVNWTCQLKIYGQSGHLQEHDGSFASGGFVTPTYSYFTADTYLCSFAYAGYSDGSASNGDEKCA